MRSNEKLKAEMYGFIDRWEQSGLNQKEFCNNEGINYYKFKYWKGQHNKEHQLSKSLKSKSKPKFIPLSIPTPKNKITGIELIFPNGVKLSCDEGLRSDQIKELVKLF